MKLTFKKWLSLALVVCLVVLAGCQAIAGVDLNGAIKKMTEIKSVESSQVLEVKLLLDEEALAKSAEDEEFNDEELAAYLDVIKQISHLKISMNEVKVEDEQNSSVRGSLEIGTEAKIDFDVRVTNELLTVKLGDANRTFSFDLTGRTTLELTDQYFQEQYGMTYEEATGMSLEDALSSNVVDEEVLASMKELQTSVTDYVTSHLPNLERISVDRVTEEINNDVVTLTKVQGELKGTEILTWVEKLLQSIVSDKEALTAFVTEIVNVLAEVDPSILGATLTQADYEELGIEYTPVSSELLTEQIVEQFVTTVLELPAALEEFKVEEEEDINKWLTDSLVIKFGIGLDSKLDIRTQDYSLEYKLAPELAEEIGANGLIGIEISAQTKYWNVNGDVKANKPVINASTVSLESLSYLQGYEILEFFKEDSLIYQFLRDTAEISKQTYYTDFEYGLYLTEDNIAMIPAREFIEELGGSVSYNAATGKYLLIDDATYTKIEVEPGSHIAYVNGEAVEWSAAVANHNNTIYIPARGIADALDAEVFWYGGGYDYSYLEIERIP